ncbi:MAG: hypothetical protein WC900_10355, partial [Oscillospiraceae bacterium]
MKTFKLKHKNRDGAILLTTLAVSTIILILIIASLTVAATAQRQTYKKFEESQAYFTAKSTIDGLLKEIDTNTTFDTYLVDLAVTGATTPVVSSKETISGYGDVTVSIYKTTTKIVKITAECEYLGVKGTSSVVLTITPPDTAPTFNSASVSFAINNYNESFTATGGVAGYTSVKLNNNTKVNGNIYVNGVLEMNSSVYVAPGNGLTDLKIESTKGIYLTNNTKLEPSSLTTSAYMNTVNFKTDSDPVVGTPSVPIDIYTCSINNLEGIYYGNVFVYNYNAARDLNPANTERKIQNGEYFGDIYV